MKIVFFNFNYSGVDSGIGIVTRNFTKKLISRGHEVHIIAQKKHKLEGHMLPSYELKNNIHIHRIRRPANLIGTIFYYFRALYITQKIAPDITHEQEPSGLGYLYKLLFRKPYVIMIHGCDVFVMRKLFTFFAKPVFESASKVISTSPDGLEAVTKNISSNINQKVISHGLDQEEFSLSEKKHTAFTIIFVGRLTKWKGIFDVLESIDLVREKKQVKLIVIGSGEDQKEVKLLAEKLGSIVEFKGQVPHNEVIKEMARCHLLVLPIHRNETQSLATLEAMALGLPVVVSNVACMQDIVQHEKNGLLIPPKHPDLLSAAILRLLNDKLLYEQIVKNNTKILKQYSYDTYTDRFEEIYQDAIQKNL